MKVSFWCKDHGSVFVDADVACPYCASKQGEAAPSAFTNSAMDEIAANLRGIDIDLLTKYNFIGTVQRIKNCLQLLHQ